MAVPSLDGRRMNAVHTTARSVVNAQTVFDFRQRGRRVWAHYAGGGIERGYLVGLRSGDDFRFRYVQQQDDGSIDGGKSRCELGLLDDGRLRLVEHFEWGSREGGGTNLLEELPAGDGRAAAAGGTGPRIEAVQPVLMSSDVVRSLAFYAQLGFAEAFRDDAEDPRYAGVGRDGVELHLQWHGEDQWVEGQDRPTTRFRVRDADGFFEAVVRGGVAGEVRPVFDTAWGTREFHVRDPDGNGLQFYCDR